MPLASLFVFQSCSLVFNVFTLLILTRPSEKFVLGVKFTKQVSFIETEFPSNRYYYDFLVVFFMEANTVFVAMVFFTRFYSDLVAMFLGFTSFFISS